jgi:hypothetical protein
LTALRHLLENRLSPQNLSTQRIAHAAALLYVLGYVGQGLVHTSSRIPEAHGSPFGSYPIKYSTNYDAQALAMWMKDHTPREASYICQNPDVMDLIAERKGYPFPMTSDTRKLIEYMNAKGIKYVLVDKAKEKDHEFLIPAILDHPARFIVIAENKRATLYEFKV